MEIKEVVDYITHHAFIADCVKDISIAALEKQISKKPIKIDKWGEYYECPVCDKYAVDNFGCKYKFCRECGQKLDWT